MSKYEDIAKMLKRRIGHEDYVVNRFSGIHKLAEDTGISYRVARQALLKLIKRNSVAQCAE